VWAYTVFMAPAVATTTITSMRTTVKNTFLELLADGDAEDSAVSVPLRRTSSSPCLLTYGAGARQIADDVSCPDLAPDVESYDSEDDDVCCLWRPAGRAPPALPGPSDLLHVQPWPCAPAKEGPDCCSKRLPGLSDLLQLQTNSKPTTAATEPTHTPFGRLLALRGLRSPAAAAAPATRTRLSTRAAAFVPGAPSPCGAPAAAPRQALQLAFPPPGPPSVREPAASAAAAPAAAEAPLAAAGGGCAETTTVMLRNLPPCYTRQMLIDLLAKKGLSQHVDFLYLPMNFQLSQNVGYSFLNVTSKEQTERLFEVFESFQDWGVDSDRLCSVCWSDTQGLDANIERYRNSPIMRKEVPDEYKPTLLSNGVPVALPKPTRQLRSLRCRRGHGVGTQ
ncbi:unnamed protein product, partial [Prorocentrum cordatum]